MPMSMASSTRGRKRARSGTTSRVRSRRSSRSAPRSQARSDDLNMVSTIMRPRGGLTSDTFRFTRWCDVSNVYNTIDGTAGGTIVTALNNDTVFQSFISLANVPAASDFSNLFSQFKITALEYHLINFNFTDVNAPANANAVQNNAAKNTAVYIGSQNDTLGIASITQCQQESGVTVRDYVNMGKPLIVKIAKPTYKSSAVNNAGTQIIDAQDQSGWLDTQVAASVPYRGFYMGIQSAFQATGQAVVVMPLYTLRCKVSMIFRGVR